MNYPYLEKSRMTMEAAKKLSNEHFASAINRAYYSCFQYIYHVIFNKLGHSRNDIVENGKGGSHCRAQLLIEQDLAKKDKNDFRWFQSNFHSFRQVRVKADYHEDMFDLDKASKAIKHAESIINTLRKHYK